MDRDNTGQYITKYEIEPELLLALYYGNRYSTKDIGDIFGCHPSTIGNKMKEYNIPTRDCYENHTKIRIEYELLLSLYWGNNFSINKISKIFDYSYERIHNLMIQNNIPIKSRYQYDSWNKGTKGVMKSNSTSFKKGLVPWNKGIEWSRMSGDNNPNYNGGTKLVTCPICNGEYMRCRKEQIFCSKKCSIIHSDRGLTTENKKVRHSKLYSDWRNKIFERDNYTCQMCNEFGGTLNAHHIKSFSEYPNLRFNINNGITLCYDCHMKLHRSK